MDELSWVYATATLVVGTFAFQVLTRKFDPFAPIWLFFVGYVQVYVVQALSYHDWAVRVRGVELVGEANFRAFWALAWFVAVYSFGPTRVLARLLPKPPIRWLVAPVLLWSPVLIIWGLFCAGLVIRMSGDGVVVSAEESLLLSFPMVMLVGGSMLVVTGRQPTRPLPALTAAGLLVVGLYMILWMFNGKRSHSLIAVLVGVCSFYLPRFRRPSFPVLTMTATMGLLAVGIAIGWRYHTNRDGSNRSLGGFVNFVSTFDTDIIVESLNLKEKETKEHRPVSYETEEYGCYLLMLDTVPMKSDFDYGESYLRVFSTFIPRVVWQDKPLYGREKWIAAWVAGSEMKRESTFTGPAIGILGAAQLNGGATGTLIVMACVALALGSGYEYFRLYADSPWVQVWWGLIYYNAWFMTVTDDPCTWFYYNYGFTTMPSMLMLWLVNKFGEAGKARI